MTLSRPPSLSSLSRYFFGQGTNPRNSSIPLENAETIVGTDSCVRHVSCGAGASPSLARLTRTLCIPKSKPLYLTTRTGSMSRCGCNAPWVSFLLAWRFHACSSWHLPWRSSLRDGDLVRVSQFHFLRRQLQCSQSQVISLAGLASGS